MEDRRKGSHEKIVRKITSEKIDEFLKVVNSTKYLDMSPYEMVPMF